MSDISELFPELQSLLDTWETAPQNGAIENENGVTDDDVEAAIQQRLARGQGLIQPSVSGQTSTTTPQFTAGSTGQAPPPTQIEETEGEPAPAPVAPGGETPAEPVDPAPAPAAPPADSIDLGEGEYIPISRVRAYAEFDSTLQSDPRLAALVSEYLRSDGRLPSSFLADYVGEGQPPVPPGPAPAPSQPSPESQLDLEDPNIRALYESQQQLQEQVRQLSAGVQESVTQQQSRMQAENESIVTRAVTSFKTQHGLNDEDINTLRQAAARLNVLPSLMQGVDPITGTPTKPDPLAAVERSLEIAYMMIPEYRQRAFAQEVQRRIDDNTRKKKLGALSGSSGSVPRSTPAPRPGTPEAKNAMIDEIGRAMNGSWSPPEE